MSFPVLRSPSWLNHYRQRGWRWLPLAVLWCALLLTAACQKQEAVVTVPTETEANEIIAALQDRGIEAKKEPAGGEDQKGWRILVVEDAFASGKAALAIRILQELGLPRPTGTGLGEDTGGGTFGGLSPTAEEAKKIKQIKTEIERQLRQLPDVARVSVNIVLPEKDIASLQPTPAKASVLLVTTAADTRFKEDDVRRLVTGGVPNLDANNVVVTIFHEPPRQLQTQLSDIEKRARINKLVTVVGVSVGLIILGLGGLLFYARRRQSAPAEAEGAPAEGSERKQLQA
ncbi:MAG: hypothetical protein SNJ67_07005 [Chloracidobacterium sp.]|uniref:Flagellar M-ring N-terminal domain-containing protein n=1 Tax=Chloracidobacterium validum TaxID=2821543 RepID=A0ABX8BCP3_9BACT|nr:hypothetical protein [Chloracidobacterium validum]QUW04688.1 hypothetical protein J8C06_13030 [Chloracidobacterium validum]